MALRSRPRHTAPVETLAGTTDIYGGVIIDPERLPADAARFGERLAASLARWRQERRRLVWLRIPQAAAALVPVAAGAGFSFHHAEPGMVMMTLPLSDDAYVPHYATHNVGGGGVVIDSQRRLLVVNERYRRDRSKPYYKLPGGSLDPQEDLAEAVEREVAEETGVRAKFEGVVCIRHRHRFRFGRSDFYVVCRLRPLSSELRRDPREIEECRWMPVTEYFASPHVGLFNRAVVRHALQGAALTPLILEEPQDYEFFAPQGPPAAAAQEAPAQETPGPQAPDQRPPERGAR